MNKYTALFIAIAVVLLFVNPCNPAEDVNLDYERIKKENARLETEISGFARINKELEDSIAILRAKKDTVIVYRDKDRKKSSEKISKARKTTEEKADSILTERFPTRKAHLIFTLEADSLRLEHHSLVEYSNLQTEELRQQNLMLAYKDSIITKKESQLILKDETIGLKDGEIQELKAKIPKAYIVGGAVGVGIGLVIAVLLAN